MKAKLKVIVCAVIVAVVALLLNNVLFGGLIKVENKYMQTRSDSWGAFIMVILGIEVHAMVIVGGLFYCIFRKKYLSNMQAKIMLLFSGVIYTGLMWGIFPIYYFSLEEQFYYTIGMAEFGNDLLLFLINSLASFITGIWACILLVLLALEYLCKKKETEPGSQT